MEEKDISKAVQSELEEIFGNPDKLLVLLRNKTETVKEQTDIIEKQTGTIQKQTKIIKSMRPKVEFYDAVTESDEWFEMSAAVKMLSIKGFGRNTVFEILRNLKVLRYNNEPYQEYIDRGYFRTIMQQFEVAGETRIYRKTMVSAKGLDFIRIIINDDVNVMTDNGEKTDE